MREVVATIVGQGRKDLVDLTLDTDGTRGDQTDKITATANHPFRVTARGWVNAVDLRISDGLATQHADAVTILAVTAHRQYAQVYNLTIADLHTYYVLAGHTPVLVHNCGGSVRVSPAAQDWGTKGAHVHVGNHEVRIFPDGSGGIGAEAIRLRSGTATTEDVQRALDEIKSHPKLRADLIGKSRSAMESMNSGEWGMASGRGAEMFFLIKALEGM